MITNESYEKIYNREAKQASRKNYVVVNPKTGWASGLMTHEDAFDYAERGVLAGNDFLICKAETKIEPAVKVSNFEG